MKLDRNLDTLREELCVAVIPGTAAPDAAMLEQLPGCLRVRPVFGDWHAVFQGTPELVRMKLRESLGLDGIHCISVPLEELFVELVGGNR